MASTLKVTATTVELVDSSSNKFYRTYDVERGLSVAQYGAQDNSGGRTGGQFRDLGPGGASSQIQSKRRKGYRDIPNVPAVSFSIAEDKYREIAGQGTNVLGKFLQNLLVAECRRQRIDLNADVQLGVRTGTATVTPTGVASAAQPVQTPQGADRLYQFSEDCLDAITAASEGDHSGVEKAVLLHGDLRDRYNDLADELDKMAGFMDTLNMLISTRL